MKLPNWFKVLWWLIILITLTTLLLIRYPDLKSGNTSTLDVIAFVIWVALLLAPIFQEVNLFGVKLKQEIKSLKEDVRHQITNLQTEVRASIQANLSQQVTLAYPTPPPDSQLPELKEKIRTAVQEEMSLLGLKLSTTEEMPSEEVPHDIKSVILARYKIEKELRRIWSAHFDLNEVQRPPSIKRMSSDLNVARIITPRLSLGIPAFYSICSPAVHGEEVTPMQMVVVKEVAPSLINILKNIE